MKKTNEEMQRIYNSEIKEIKLLNTNQKKIEKTEEEITLNKQAKNIINLIKNKYFNEIVIIQNDINHTLKDINFNKEIDHKEIDNIEGVLRLKLLKYKNQLPLISEKTKNELTIKPPKKCTMEDIEKIVDGPNEQLMDYFFNNKEKWIYGIKERTLREIVKIIITKQKEVLHKIICKKKENKNLEDYKFYNDTMGYQTIEKHLPELKKLLNVNSFIGLEKAWDAHIIISAAKNHEFLNMSLEERKKVYKEYLPKEIIEMFPELKPKVLQ